MKPVEWANFIWLSLLILSFIIAVIYIIVDTRKSGKGRIGHAFRKMGNWIKIVVVRIGSDMREVFSTPSGKRKRRMAEAAKAEEYKKAALLRYECPNCKHLLLNIPAVPEVDRCTGTKYYCLNCKYERIEKDES